MGIRLDRLSGRPALTEDQHQKKTHHENKNKTFYSPPTRIIAGMQ